MPADLGALFQQRLAAAACGLRGVSEEEASRPVREGGWLRKEILGHLIDSAVNNHLRFLIAASQGEWAGKSYDQKDWIRLHGYARMRWATVFELWRSHNALLQRLVVEIPESTLGNRCRIGDNADVTLDFLIHDYLDHLDGHVAQIAGAGKRLSLNLLPWPLAICRLDASAAVPDWEMEESFCSVTRSESELSIVWPATAVPRGVTCDAGWRALQVEGPLGLSTVGVLASLALPLAEAGISIFAVSTYDTDMLLVKEADTEAAAQALQLAGHIIRR